MMKRVSQAKPKEFFNQIQYVFGLWKCCTKYFVVESLFLKDDYFDCVFIFYLKIMCFLFSYTKRTQLEICSNVTRSDATPVPRPSVVFKSHYVQDCSVSWILMTSLRFYAGICVFATMRCKILKLDF